MYYVCLSAESVIIQSIERVCITKIILMPCRLEE